MPDAPVKAGIGASLWRYIAEEAGRFDLGFETGGKRQVHRRRQIQRPGDYRDSTTWFCHPNHFGQHSVGIGLFDNRYRHYDFKAVVGKRQRLGIAIAKLDRAFEPLLPGEGLGLAQQIGG